MFNASISPANPDPQSSAPEISVDDLARSLKGSEPPVIAEILGPQYFDAGHLPGALNLPLEGFSQRALELLPDKNADVVVYCASSTCRNSDVAARQLLGLGFTRVRVFRGGKAAWKEAGHPLTR